MDKCARIEQRRLFRQLRDQRKKDEKETSFLERERLRWEQWEEKKKRMAQAAVDHERFVQEYAQSEFDEQLDKDFKGAVHRMSLLRKEPPMDDLVKAHGLYMQAVMGDVNQDRPDSSDVAECAKWDAWTAFRGMTRDEARIAYVKHHNWLVTQYGWRPMGHVWDRSGNWLPDRRCDLCEPLWDGWKPKRGWWDSDDEDDLQPRLHADSHGTD